MIDWFVSKIGLLAFILVSIGALIALAGMQLDLFDQSIKIQAANDLARIMDGMCDNCSLTYSLEKNWTLTLEQNSLTLGGVKRGLFTQANPITLTASKLKISKTGGVVNVTA